ncbi:hypothetical protein HK099_001881 [Clydaea vesicula]|uniref:Glutathione S-transferase n=1 Tax=Clydaea vesicula TaxID=447962 RepID=A0AAD5TTY4_9FUNG|nr:hypothetical protein HK099_001881 [Clydaea vesicula]KAJ3379134.1 hypothetical protein HDU92_006894 [Lobulomyces angularis]
MSATLYFTTTSCGAASFIAAHKAGVIGSKVVPVIADIKKKLVLTGSNKGSDFFKVNPKGNVPALVLSDGKLLNENAATLQYIADLNPAAKLAPANGTNERYVLQSKLSFLSSEVHSSVGSLFSAPAGDIREYFVQKANTKLSYLEKVELPGKKFLVGDNFTVADSYLYIILSWLQFLNIDLATYPVLKSYYENIASLDFVKEAHAKMAEIAKEAN